MLTDYQPTIQEDERSERAAGKIRQRILKQGPIPFDGFMEMALYDPEYGYYQAKSGIIGRGGDFVTSPEVGPLFGCLLAIYLAGVWRETGFSKRLHVRDFGAGQGGLCQGVLRFLRARVPDCHAAVRYLMIEKSHAMRQRLGAMIEQHCLAGQCAVVDVDDFIAEPETPHVVFANEFLDALPVHWVVCRNKRLLEKHVDWVNGRFVALESEPSTARLVQYFKWLGVELADGQEATVNVAALDWLERVSIMNAPLRLLIIDYGFLADELLCHPERSVTLTCYQGQTANHQPLHNVGSQDITSHVDFSALMRRGAELGLSVRRYTSQLDFLLELVSSSQDWFDWEGDLELRLNLKELVHPEHMGEAFRVLELVRASH